MPGARSVDDPCWWSCWIPDPFGRKEGEMPVQDPRRGQGAEVVTTNLSGEADARVREVFAD